MFCAMFATLCFFSSCEQKVEVSEEGILGKWQVVSVGEDRYQDGKLISSHTEDYEKLGVKAYLEFKANGVLIQTEGEGKDAITHESTWKLRGSILTMDVDEFQVKELTSSKMKLASVIPPDYTEYYQGVLNLVKVK